MTDIIIEIINQFGYLGVIVLIAVENIFPPIPSEVILTFGGFATTISNITVVGAIIASTIGSLIGAIVLYGIGRYLNEDRIEKIAGSRVGKILGIEKGDINKSFDWFNSRGKYAVFFGRFIPIVRSLVSIPAGMSRMAIIPFLFLTTIGSIIWNTVLISLGRIAGKSWNRIAIYVGNYSDAVLVIFLAVFVLGIIISYIKKKVRIVRIRKTKYNVKKLEM